MPHRPTDCRISQSPSGPCSNRPTAPTTSAAAPSLSRRWRPTPARDPPLDTSRGPPESRSSTVRKSEHLPNLLEALLPLGPPPGTATAQHRLVTPGRQLLHQPHCISSLVRQETRPARNRSACIPLHAPLEHRNSSAPRTNTATAVRPRANTSASSKATFKSLRSYHFATMPACSSRAAGSDSTRRSPASNTAPIAEKAARGSTSPSPLRVKRCLTNQRRAASDPTRSMSALQTGRCNDLGNYSFTTASHPLRARCAAPSFTPPLAASSAPDMGPFTS